MTEPNTKRNDVVVAFIGRGLTKTVVWKAYWRDQGDKVCATKIHTPYHQDKYQTINDVSFEKTRRMIRTLVKSGLGGLEIEAFFKL